MLFFSHCIDEADVKEKDEEEGEKERSDSPLVDTRVQVQKMFSQMIRKSPGGGLQMEKPPSTSSSSSPMKLSVQGLSLSLSLLSSLSLSLPSLPYSLSLPPFLICLYMYLVL